MLNYHKYNQRDEKTSDEKEWEANLSLTALPDKTPPYARFTVLLFLASLDLLYSAGLK